MGTYTDSDVAGGSDVILINYDYFDEARLAGKGTVNHFNVAISDPRQAVAVADAIDRRFANSSNATRTESLRELAQLQMQSIGDLDFLIRAVVAAVLVALFFATATMLMQSTRERTPEFAVLKTLGFTTARCSSSFSPRPHSFSWQPRHSGWRSRSLRSRLPRNSCLDCRCRCRSSRSDSDVPGWCR